MGLHYGPKRLKSVTRKDYEWPGMFAMIKPFYAVIFCKTRHKNQLVKLAVTQWCNERWVCLWWGCPTPPHQMWSCSDPSAATAHFPGCVILSVCECLCVQHWLSMKPLWLQIISIWCGFMIIKKVGYHAYIYTEHLRHTGSRSVCSILRSWLLLIHLWLNKTF